MTKRGPLQKVWTTTSVFLAWEHHKQYEEEKDRTLKDELPKSVGAQYATGEEWRNNSRKNEETKPTRKQCLVVDVTGDGSKVWCYKEQNCIGTWDAKSMNRGKLEIVKREMARVNIYILGISKRKWTRMGKFNLDDHYTYYCGQNSLIEEME